MATARLSPRLLDQRLDQGFDLLAVERFVRTIRAGWARWSCDGHACLPDLVELVLLAY